MSAILAVLGLKICDLSVLPEIKKDPFGAKEVRHHMVRTHLSYQISIPAKHSANVTVEWSLSLLNFVYFWLCWVFVAAHGLSLVSESRGYSLAVCTYVHMWAKNAQTTAQLHSSHVLVK